MRQQMIHSSFDIGQIGLVILVQWSWNTNNNSLCMTCIGEITAGMESSSLEQTSDFFRREIGQITLIVLQLLNFSFVYINAVYRVAIFKK
ncbi:hypothetical protein D3C81_1845130 [compost metagenome]